MTKPLLYWVWDDGEDIKYLQRDFEYYDHHESAEKESISLEQLADMLDQEAEDANFHQFVGAHRGLAFLLHKTCGRESATNIFWELALLEGLQGLESNLHELNIPGCWEEWGLKDATE